jgi:hypothetical protein
MAARPIPVVEALGFSTWHIADEPKTAALDRSISSDVRRLALEGYARWPRNPGSRWTSVEHAPDPEPEIQDPVTTTIGVSKLRQFRSAELRAARGPQR